MRAAVGTSGLLQQFDNSRLLTRDQPMSGPCEQGNIESMLVEVDDFRIGVRATQRLPARAEISLRRSWRISLVSLASLRRRRSHPITGTAGCCARALTGHAGPAKGRRGSAAFPIPDHLLRRGTLPLSANTGNRGSFQRHGDWDSFGVAREHAMKLLYRFTEVLARNPIRAYLPGSISLSIEPPLSAQSLKAPRL